MDDELSYQHARLVEDLTIAAERRGRKAPGQLGGPRLEGSAAALSAAARDVAALPADDPRLVHLVRFYGADDEAVGTYLEKAHRIIDRHDLFPGGTQTTDELLAALVSAADEATDRSLDERLELQDDDKGGGQERTEGPD